MSIIAKIKEQAIANVIVDQLTPDRIIEAAEQCGQTLTLPEVLGLWAELVVHAAQTGGYTITTLAGEHEL